MSSSKASTQSPAQDTNTDPASGLNQQTGQENALKIEDGDSLVPSAGQPVADKMAQQDEFTDPKNVHQNQVSDRASDSADQSDQAFTSDGPTLPERVGTEVKSMERGERDNGVSQDVELARSLQKHSLSSTQAPRDISTSQQLPPAELSNHIATQDDHSTPKITGDEIAAGAENGNRVSADEPSLRDRDQVSRDTESHNQDSTHSESEGEYSQRTRRSTTQEESGPEIQTIMSQFKDVEDPKPADAESPRPDFPVFQYPPRLSSLEHRRHSSKDIDHNDIRSPRLSFAATTASGPKDMEKSQSNSSSVSQPPPPVPDPEPDLPFDFHRFLDQLKHKSADPVAKFLKSFLQEFGKKQWMVHEQVKLINDFLTFIGNRMAKCDVWRSVSDAEFDNAKEGMEKLVMSKLYSQTFPPEIPPIEPLKGRRKGNAQPMSPGRRGQHQEDVERDEIMAQKVRIYSWVQEQHLDIKPFADKGKKYLSLAQQELSKVKSYRAPRDKVICVLNCCKLLFGCLRQSQSDQSADSFIPLLIYTVLKANPDHLVSNVQFILRFRNQDKLNGEAGYYMSSLMGAVQFIENLDRTSLTIGEEEFEKNVENAVSAIAERNEREDKRGGSSGHLHFSEKSTPSRAEVTPRNSLEGEQVSPRRAMQRQSPSRGMEASRPDDNDDNAAVAGLLRTIQKPLNSIGRIFSEEPANSPAIGNQPVPTSSLLEDAHGPPVPQRHGFPTSGQPNVLAAEPPGLSAQHARQSVVAENEAARQASAESAEAHRIQRAEHQTVVETLTGMFPDLDRDVISDVVRMKEGSPEPLMYGQCNARIIRNTLDDNLSTANDSLNVSLKKQLRSMYLALDYKSEEGPIHAE
ncbi:MAG: hypothetical protein M1831_005916 [Alyxoria varia]|nr:MAG: hypothetical protein M1831_005916 [Alyxoria varia]